MVMFIVLLSLIPISYYVFITALTWKRRNYIEGKLTLIMGKAGSGKSTIMGTLVKSAIKEGRPIYSNHHVLGAIQLKHTDLGKYMLENVDIIIDEAQLHFDNRSFKSFSEENKFFFSNFRHFGIRVFILSQSFEDLDVKIRRQAQFLYIVQPFIKGLVLMQKVRMKFGVSEDESDIITLYKFNALGYRIKCGFLVWKYFDSYSKPNLPEFYSDGTWGSAPIKKSIKDIPKRLLAKRKKEIEIDMFDLKEELEEIRQFDNKV